MIDGIQKNVRKGLTLFIDHSEIPYGGTYAHKFTKEFLPFAPSVPMTRATHKTKKSLVLFTAQNDSP